MAEKEYIEREAFIKWVEETYCKPCEAEGRDYNHCRCGACQYDDMMRDADSFPAADVRPVVRCKDCKYGSKCLMDMIQCKIYDRLHSADWFCAGGEHKNLKDAAEAWNRRKADV